MFQKKTVFIVGGIAISLTFPYYGEAASSYKAPSPQTCQEIHSIFQENLDIEKFFNDIPAETRGESEEFQKWRKMEEDFHLKYPDFIVKPHWVDQNSPSRHEKYAVNIDGDKVKDEFELLGCGWGKYSTCDIKVILSSIKNSYKEEIIGKHVLINHRNTYYLAYGFDFTSDDPNDFPTFKIKKSDKNLVYWRALQITKNGIKEACENPDLPLREEHSSHIQDSLSEDKTSSAGMTTTNPPAVTPDAKRKGGLTAQNTPKIPFLSLTLERE